jgi:capsid protein
MVLTRWQACMPFVMSSTFQLELAQQQPQQKANDPFTAARPKRSSRSSNSNSTKSVSSKEDDYQRVLGLSYLFYEGQMSGNLPRWNRLLASKPAGYKHSAHIKDGAEIGVDLSGGYYDAGGEISGRTCPAGL